MTKILECVSCGTCYESPAGFPPEGRKVRCAKCGEVWHAVARELKSDPEPDLDDDRDDIVFRDQDEPDEPEIEAETEPEPEPEADNEDFAEDFAEEAEPEPEPDFEKIATSETDEPVPDEADEPAAEEPSEVAEAEPEEIDPVRDPPPGAPVGPSLAARLVEKVDPVSVGWGALVLFLSLVTYAAYGWRVDVVRAVPGTAWAYAKLGVPVNVRGLGFGPVAYHWAVEAGRPVLEVEGEIRNLTNRPLVVPTVVFALRNAVDVEVYQWAADIREGPLPGGERTLFLARIPSPPKSIGSVQVRFARPR